MRSKARSPIRVLTRADIEAVERLSRRGSDSPWGRAFWEKTLSIPNVGAFALASASGVLGYAVGEPVDGQLLIAALVVDPDYRRLGVGSALMARLRFQAASTGRSELYTVVRERNLGGQLFLRSHGFRAYHVERNAWPDTGEDGYAFRREVDFWRE